MEKNQHIAGVIGLGNIAYKMDLTKREDRLWTHIETYKSSINIDKIIAYEENLDAIKEFQKHHPEIFVTNSFQEFIEKKPTIVSICTPTVTHYNFINELIKLGIKKIWCEKMLCNSYEEAIKIKKNCKDNDVTLFINYMRRWDQLFIKVKKHLDNNDIGKVYTVIARTSTALKMQSSHMVDLLIWYFGTPHLIHSEIQKDFVRSVHGEDDPGGTLYLTFKEYDCLCLLHARSTSPLNYLWELEIIGQTGRILVTTEEELLLQKFSNLVKSTGKHMSLATQIRYDSKSNNSCRLSAQLNEIIESKGFNKNSVSMLDDSITALKLYEKL
tara:strand:- start:8046 stop:9026 length:981 start_codon:yes stop_codon:yes gene_type:complete